MNYDRPLADGGPDARSGEISGTPVIRSYGDPDGEYEALRRSAGIVHRADLSRVRIWGRDPVRMLNGLITNDLEGLTAGRSVYAAMLTPKGRMITDLRVVARSVDNDKVLIVVVPTVSIAAVGAHLAKYVPPMFARWEEEDSVVIGVYGPESAGAVEAVLGVPVGRAEGDVSTGRYEGQEVPILRTRFVGNEIGFDVLSPTGIGESLWLSMQVAVKERGGRPVGFDAIETARVEAGHPRFGADMTDESMPAEVYPDGEELKGMVSFTKGCYTGQEVVVRIAHRGHVNRRIVGLLLGGNEPPVHRTPLYGEGGREVGWTTSAVVSPGVGETIALAMVRREIEPGALVRVASADGPAGKVTALPFV